MPQTIKRKLEEQLAEMHGRKHCIIVSRGAVAIYLALKVLGQNGGKVVLPSIMCLSPANSVIYAGFQPIFCDVNLDNFNLDPSALERILKTEKVQAVILPHIYGRPGDLDKLSKLTKKYKVKLIEDAAQALGGEYRGKPLGSFGDLSILSFGHTKIVNAGGGGALLFDEDKYVDVVAGHFKQLPDRDKNHRYLQAQYSKAYYALQSLAKENPALAKLYSPFPFVFRPLFLHKGIEERWLKNLEKGLRDLRANVTRRNENAEYWRAHLQHEKITHIEEQTEGVCWRYSFMIKRERQLALAEKIRKESIEVSNWYPPVHLFYASGSIKLKKAEYAGRHIFNLWVDPVYTKRKIKRDSDIFMRVLDE